MCCNNNVGTSLHLTKQSGLSTMPPPTPDKVSTDIEFDKNEKSSFTVFDPAYSPGETVDKRRGEMNRENFKKRIEAEEISEIDIVFDIS